MFKTCLVSGLLFFTTFLSQAGVTEKRSVKVGDEISIYTTPHQNTQSVIWDWDESVLELQGRMFSSSTSATFKVIGSISSSGSIIQAVTYYYESGTTSSGINKDIDVWKIYYTNEDTGSSENDKNNGFVNLNYSNLNLLGGDYIDLIATVYNGASNTYRWSSSDPSVAILSTTGNNVARVVAKLPGTTIIRVTINNGNHSDCVIEVTEKNQIELLNFVMNDDNISYNVKRKDNAYPKGQLTIPSHYNGIPVTMIADNAFSYISGLETVIIPSTVTEIGKAAFQSCHSLARIDIPVSVVKIGELAFDYCKKLKSFSLPPNIVNIEKGTFSDCISLTSFILHDNIISVGDFAFSGCTGIRLLDIPQSVQEIGFGAFSCEDLREIYVHWVEPLICRDPFLFDKIFDNTILYTPEGSKKIYYDSVIWKDFKNIREKKYTGIDITEDSNIDKIDYGKPYSVYDTQGRSINRMIEQLSQGIYIIKQGDVTEKIFR